MELLLQLPSGPQPFYRKLASALRSSLESGQLRVGDLLPSTRRLADNLGVHRHTIMTALDELVAEGWLQSEPGRGYRVVESLNLTPLPVRGDFPYPMRAHAWRSEETHKEGHLAYRFPSGIPDLRLFPHEEYFACIREALRRTDSVDLLGYSQPAGRPAFRSQLAKYLRRGRNLQFQDDELVVTHGCQEAVFLLAQLLLEPGAGVAVEELGFSAMWDALGSTGAKLYPVELDGEGVVPDALERVLQNGTVRLIYLTPEHQYPTTVTLSLQRRQAIYALAKRYGACILEDDYDHEFHYRSHPIPPMKAYDPDGIVLYCSTLSKVMHASVRLGFAIVPANVARQLSHLKRICSRQNDNLSQEAVALWMEEGGFERHLRRMRRAYSSRRDLMVKVLQGERVRFTPPDGGMCVWADMGVDTDLLSALAEKRGVEIRPGRTFAYDGQSGHTWLRLGFAYPTEEEIEAGLTRLLDARSVLLGEALVR